MSQSQADLEKKLAGPSLPSATRRAWYGSALYRAKTAGRAPDRLRGRPPDPWTGNPTHGRFILDGQFIIDGLRLNPGENPFVQLPESESAALRLHGFSWLRDLKALASDAARERARALIRAWLKTHGRWSPFVWRADVTGTRITTWLQASDFLLNDTDPAFTKDLFAALAQQCRHLPHALEDLGDGWGRIAGLCGLIHGAACLPGCEPLAGPALNQLDKAIEDQVLADGGHRSRNPSRQLACLRQLLDIRGILAAARVEAPDGLQRGIDRMAPILRLFKMGDGGLAVFNGGSEEEPAEVEAALALAAFKGRALASAPHLGFQRLSAGRLAVVVDAGAPAEAPFDTGAHAGTLAFEASSGRDRLVVNCGTPLIEGPLAEAMRATAAHSALTIDDHNTAEIIDGGGIGRRPGQVTVLRRQHEGALWMETAEDGYKSPPYGLFHRRTFYLAPGGEELRGEDWLTRLPGNDGAARKATARFHLHPLTQASLLSGGKGVLIKLASGQGWRFLVRGGEVTLEESLYLGEPGHRRKAQQIVVTGRVPAISEDVGGTGLKLQWAFHREKR